MGCVVDESVFGSHEINNPYRKLEWDAACVGCIHYLLDAKDRFRQLKIGSWFMIQLVQNLEDIGTSFRIALLLR